MAEPRTVVGLDLSLSATGVAVLQVGGWPVLSTVRSGPGADSLAMRRARIDTLAGQIAEHCHGADLAVIEGPSLGSSSGWLWERAGLWWTVLHRLADAFVPVAEVAPATLKKFASGSGRGDKTAVAVGLSRLWQEVVTGRNDNEWDALALATIGAQHLGMDVPSRAHHAEALAKVAWPSTDAEGGAA